MARRFPCCSGLKSQIARHVPVDAARVDHQHLVAVRRGLGAVQEPQLARHGAGVEEVLADGDHHIDGAGLHQLAPHRGLAAAGARRLRRHDEAGAAGLVQIAVEVADPDVVAVADLLLPVDAGQAERQAGVGPGLVGVDLVDVERRIGHDVVGPAEQLVRVFVVGDGLPDVALEPVHGEVHFGEADGGLVLLDAAEGEALRGALAVLLHGAGALDEHAAGAAGGVEHGAAVGVEHVGDERDQRHGGEELAAVVGLLVGELREEVLVDAAEDVAVGVPELVGVQLPQQVAEDVVVQRLVLALGQDAAQAVVVLLDGLHGRDDGGRPIRAVGQGDEVIELRRGTEEDGVLLREVLPGDRPLPAPAHGQTRRDRVLDGEVAAVGVAQEHQAHDRQEVLVAGVLGVRAQRVGGAPKAPFDGLDVLELGHACRECTPERTVQASSCAIRAVGPDRDRHESEAVTHMVHCSVPRGRKSGWRQRRKQDRSGRR